MRWGRYNTSVVVINILIASSKRVLSSDACQESCFLCGLQGMGRLVCYLLIELLSFLLLLRRSVEDVVVQLGEHQLCFASFSILLYSDLVCVDQCLLLE